MTDTPFVRRVLWASSAVCFVAGLLGFAVVVSGDDKPGSSNLASTGATTTTVANVGTAAPPAGGGAAATTPAPATTAAPSTKAKAGGQANTTPTTAKGSGGGSGGGSPTTVAAASSFKDLGPVADAGAVSTPGPGVYHYTYKSGKDSTEAATKIENKGASPGGGQNLTISTTGQGFDAVNDVTWGPSEVRVLKSTFAFGTQRAECDWNPDYLDMQTGMSKGSQWSADTSCVVNAGPRGAVPVTRKTTKKVTDARKVQVAGNEIMVWVIESTDHLEFAGNASDITATDYFSPKHGLSVRTTGHAKGSNAKGESEERDFEAEIKSLQPS